MKRSRTIVEFERLSSHRSEQDSIELEDIGGCTRYAEVAAMWRIEGPSEEGQPFAPLAIYQNRTTSPVDRMFAVTGPVVPL